MGAAADEGGGGREWRRTGAAAAADRAGGRRTAAVADGEDSGRGRQLIGGWGRLRTGAGGPPPRTGPRGWRMAGGGGRGGDVGPGWGRLRTGVGGPTPRTAGGATGAAVNGSLRPPPRQGHVRSFRFPPAPATVTTHTQTDRQTYGMNEVSRPQPKRSTRVHGPTEAQDSSPTCQAVHERHAHNTTTPACNKRAARTTATTQRAWNMHAGPSEITWAEHPAPQQKVQLHSPSSCSPLLRIPRGARWC